MISESVLRDNHVWNSRERGFEVKLIKDNVAKLEWFKVKFNSQKFLGALMRAHAAIVSAVPKKAWQYQSDLEQNIVW